MSFDSLTLRSVTKQLNETVITGTILSVIQSSPFEFTLKIAADKGTYNLLFSIHPVYARIHLTQEQPKQTKRWHFADFLLKHIGHGVITDIQQVNSDRIIKVRIVTREEIVEPAPKILIGEFMGKHSNVMLVEEKTNRILESMKHIDETMSRYRQVLPGLDYVAPPMNQMFEPLSTDAETFYSILASDSGPIWKKLLKNFRGVSPLLAKEIVARSPDNSPTAVRNTFMSLMADIRGEKFCPTVIVQDGDEDNLLAVSAIRLQQFQNGRAINFPTISDALEFFYQRRIAEESLSAAKTAILQAVNRKYEALQQKHESLSQQLRLAESADEFKMKGDLLIANIHNIKRGQKEVRLQNFYHPRGEEITIDLDEKLNPASNAQRYFDTYKKAKRSKDVLEKLMRKNQDAMDYLSKVMEETENAEDLTHLKAIRDSLEQKGIIRKKKASPRKPGEEAPLFRRFKSSEGFQIYVGRNKKENELLLRSESSRNDMWLHAKQIEGSYVIVRNPQKRQDIPRRTLLEAAIIAAFFSKARHSSTVPVDYTWVKYVNKPRGAKAGFVTYTHEKTLFVSPADFEKLTLDRRA